MIYFIRGENSYSALKKIKELKTAFSQKNQEFLAEEADGDLGEISEEEFSSFLGQKNLFTKKRLVIFKNIFGEKKGNFNIFKNSAEALKKSPDIFVFWERNPEKIVSAAIEKYSEKTQDAQPLKPSELDKWLEKKAKEAGVKLSKGERALMIDEAGEGAEWALDGELEKLFLRAGAPSEISLTPSRFLFKKNESGTARPRLEISSATPALAPNPFQFVDRMFGPRALLALKEMYGAGIEPQRFIYAFLWKLKQKRMTDAYFEGIKTESLMKRDPQNAEEILERFISSLKV